MSALDRAGVLVARHFPVRPQAPARGAGRPAAAADGRPPLVDPLHNTYDVAAILSALAAAAKTAWEWARVRPKLCFGAALFIVLGALSIKFGFGSVFFSVCGIVFIFRNLGERKAWELSSYSIFNEGFVSLPGTTTAADVEAQLRHAPLPPASSSSPTPNRTPAAAAAATAASGAAPGTRPGSSRPAAAAPSEDPRALLARLGTRPCPCGSGKRYKRCCFAGDAAAWAEARSAAARRLARGRYSTGTEGGDLDGHGGLGGDDDDEGVDMGYGADLSDDDVDG